MKRLLHIEGRQIETIICEPAGSIRTSLDIELDQVPKRFCGMCTGDATGRTLNDICQHCKHRFGWFQLLTDVTAVGDRVANERELTEYINAYQEEERKKDEADQLAGFLDPYDIY